MLEAVTSALSTALTWVGSVVSALVTESGALYALLPLFGIGVAISAIMLGVKVIKSFVWGS